MSKMTFEELKAAHLDSDIELHWLPFGKRSEERVNDALTFLSTQDTTATLDEVLEAAIWSNIDPQNYLNHITLKALYPLLAGTRH